MPGMFVNYEDDEVTITMTVDQANVLGTLINDAREYEMFEEVWASWGQVAIRALDDCLNGTDDD